MNAEPSLFEMESSELIKYSDPKEVVYLMLYGSPDEQEWGRELLKRLRDEKINCD